MSDLFKCPKPTLTEGEKWGDNCLVTYPVSYTYNGGITIKDKWYAGYEVPPPDVPEGYELVGISCGLQLNCQPPLATRYLKPLPYMNTYQCCEEDRTIPGKINERKRCPTCQQASEPVSSVPIDLKEHDIVRVCVEGEEFVSSPIEAKKDEFKPLPVGTKGTIVSRVAPDGCYVEFPYITKHYPEADAVIWLTHDKIQKA